MLDFLSFENDMLIWVFVLFCFVFVFVILDVLWAPWICGLVPDINLRKFGYYCFKYFLCSFLSFFSFWYSLYAHVTPLLLSHSPWMLCSVLFSLFSLCFSDFKDSIGILSSSKWFLFPFPCWKPEGIFLRYLLWESR